MPIRVEPYAVCLLCCAGWPPTPRAAACLLPPTPARMNDKNFGLAAQLVDGAYIEQARQARRVSEQLLKNLLAQRAVPEQPCAAPPLDPAPNPL
jgi:hypothetical protein